MSYAAPYPNCSTQYSKSFPLLTTRTHTPNRPSHYYEIHCPTPVDSMSSATRGGGSRMGVVPSILPLSSRMAGTHPTPCCPRGCGDPSHSPCPHDPLVPWPPSLEDAPLLSAHVLTVIPSPVIPTEAGTHPFPLSHLRYTQPPHIIVPSPT